MDNQATADQAVEAAREMGRPLAALYKKLREEGVDEHTASQIALMYAAQVMRAPEAR